MTTPDEELDPLDFGDGPPPLDFGHGVRGRWIEDSAGHYVGLHYSHPMPTPPVPGRRCMGSIYFNTPEARAVSPTAAAWVLNTVTPLDVSPSLLCMTCSHHGFIRGGQWVPA